MGVDEDQGINGEIELQHHFGYIIPLQGTLRRIVRNPSFLTHVAHLHNSQDGILRDDCDGYITRNHPLFQAFPDSLRIRFYYDDVDVADAVGSHTCNIGAFYFTLQNLPPKFRSKLDNIFIVAIANRDAIKKFGVELLLADFRLQMNEFAQGIPIQLTPNHEHVFFAFLVGLFGDNPALNFLLGFKESVGPAFRGCRECFGTINERQFLVCILPFLPCQKQIY